MMTLANYGIGSSKSKDPNSAKSLSKSLQIRNRAESSLKQCLKHHYRIPKDERAEILASIKNYYARVSFNVIIWNKYQTKQCIVDSILQQDKKFNPYRALKAFILLEDMLLNLIHLPWHHEFRRIHLYSGEFYSSVCDPLIGVEEILKAAGFIRKTQDHFEYLVLPEDKMPQTDDSESVTSVIFDLMIGQVVFNEIIDIFENSCKSSKFKIEQLMPQVNCYSWIQAFFHERSHQVEAQAYASVRELINNVTNHLSRFEPVTVKSSSTNRLEKPISTFISQRTSNERIDTTGSHEASIRNNGYAANEQQRYPPTTTHNHQMPATRYPAANHDTIDHHRIHLSGRTLDENVTYTGHDIPHNDREPLLSRQNHRGLSLNQRILQPKRDHLSSSGGTSRHNYNSNFSSSVVNEDLSSQMDYMNHHLKDSTSKYNDNSSCKKYETREVGKTKSSHWSCGACTYNNPISNDVCEMCRNRKPSR